MGSEIQLLMKEKGSLNFPDKENRHQTWHYIHSNKGDVKFNSWSKRKWELKFYEWGK
jgi:hypothetical protein